jgi:recombination protein RecR
MKYPKSIQNLIDMFSMLPTVGPKTAERYVFYLLKKNPEELKKFSDAMLQLKSGTTVCNKCYAISESNPCTICADGKRNPRQVCVVADTRDMISVENTGQYNGLYHILNGELDAIEGIRPEQLTINQLIGRIKNDGVNEVILALNPTMEGETTALYLAKLLKQPPLHGLKITRIARGLPMGSNLEYADEMTLSNAMRFRNEM